MLYKITGNQPFQVNSDSFSISPSESGYDLYLSADGVNYSNFVTVASGVTKQMVNMNSGNYYILSGNTSTVTVNWERECGGGGGGGGTAGVSSLDGQTGALTLKTVNNNSLLGSGNIEISGGDSAATVTSAVTAANAYTDSAITEATEKSYVLEDLSQSEAEALYNEIYSACTLGKDNRPDTKTFPTQNYKFYGKIEQDAYFGLVEMYLARYEATKSFTFTGVAGSRQDSKNLFIKVIRIRYNGQIDVNKTNIVKTDYNSVFMLTLSDLTGGTPTWRYRANFDDLKNLKDGHNNGKAFINIYLFYDLGNEYKPYAIANAWVYDGENGNSDFYFYFDDVEINNTRYRAVYKWNSNNSSWTTVYWDTYKNYIASL